MNALLRESDACLWLVEEELVAGRYGLPAPLYDRLRRLATASGYRQAPPMDGKGAHEYVLSIQGERLLPHADTDEVPRDRQRRFVWAAQGRPVLGSLRWLGQQQAAWVVDPEWAWQAWREAADLAKAEPRQPGRVAAMQEAWAYYWALTAVDEQPAEPERRAA